MKIKNLEDHIVEDKDQTGQENDKSREMDELLLDIYREKLELRKAILALEAEESGSVDREIMLLAENAPTGAVVLAWSQLEQEIISTALRLLLDYPFAAIPNPSINIYIEELYYY